MTSAEIYAAGYAIPVYNINSNLQNWRFHDEQFKTFPMPMIDIELVFKVARIEDVRANAI